METQQYLFASAEYATPIRFKVKGFGDPYANVFIFGIGADLYLDGSCVKADIPKNSGGIPN